MPIQFQNLDLLLRSTPGGLQSRHSNFISSQADHSLKSDLFSDLILLTPDGVTSCHQSIIAPLSPLFKSLLTSYPSYPGLVHTIVTPINLHTVNNILQIIYTGRVSVTSRHEVHLVMDGLQELGIQLPGLKSFKLVRSPQDCTMQGGRTVESNNNEIPRPFSTSQLPEDSTSLQTSIVRLHDSWPDMKPLPNNLPLTPTPRLSMAKLGFYAFKCDLCNIGFKVKKAQKEHNIKNHMVMLNTEVVREVLRNDDPLITMEIEPNFIVENVEEAPIVRTRKRKRSIDMSYVEDNEADENEAVDDPDSLTEETEPVAKQSLFCVQCQADLPSEWPRNPRGHVCPHAIPKANKTPTKLPSVKLYRCSLCDTSVPSSWHKPPSRHSCTAITPSTDSPAAVGDIQSSAEYERRKKARKVSSTDVSVKKVKGKLESSANKLDLPADYPCPLTNCFRQCTNKRSLLVHLAIVHYKEELAKLIVNECGPNKCSDCSMVLPSNKVGTIMHMAVEHDMVMKFAKRDKALEVYLIQASGCDSNIDLTGED